jgi:hypothetical protein
MMKFGNKNKDTNLLVQALSTRRQPVSGGKVTLPNMQKSNSGDNVLGGATDLLGGGTKLLNGLSNSGLFQNNSSSGLGIFGNAANDYISEKPDYGIFGNAANESIMGSVGGGSAVGDAVNSEVGGGFSGGSLPWGAIASVAKGGYNTISGHNDKDYSDLEESIIYPLQGAGKAAGYSGGNPWAALGGALYGLGYSFKDDLGLKDSNFLTQMLFPLDMGDGGGLKISGQPVTTGIL